MRTKKKKMKYNLPFDPLWWTENSIRAWLDATHRAGLHRAGDERFDRLGEPSF